MSSLPPSSTPPAGDDSAPESLHAADAAPESSPAAASAPESPPADDAATASPLPASGPAQEDCGPQLKKLYPALFSNPPKPLKLRIQADIQARSPGLFTKPQLSAFLRRYTGSHGYLNAIVKATHRYDLDGNPGDELSDEHRQAATDELARRRTNTQARIALENEQRFNRATLLREFEATTLSPTDFAASKGVPEAELDPLLARARREALEPPPPPVFNRDRRGPRTEGPRGPQGPRNDRPPRDANASAGAPAAADGAPRPDAPRSTRSDAPRGPRSDAPRGPRTDTPRGPRTDGPQGPRTDGPRGPQGARTDRPQGPRADAAQAPRPEGARPDGPRPEGQRGPRPDGPRGPRADGQRNPNGPRSDAPRGPRRDDDRRGPRPDDTRMPRPNVVSSPAAPTAMALAFSALRNVKTNSPATDAKNPAPSGKRDK
jgi:ProP effector